MIIVNAAAAAHVEARLVRDIRDRQAERGAIAAELEAVAPAQINQRAGRRNKG
jgi:hypothetical protein